MASELLVLDASNSRAYMAKPVEKHAVLVWQPATYTLSWGTQNFEGPHMKVDGEYGADLQVFYATHQPVAAREHYYVKVVKVRAFQVKEDTDINTIVRGNEEMKAKVQKDGWIIQNPTGEIYYNSDEEFKKRYVLDEEPAK